MDREGFVLLGVVEYRQPEAILKDQGERPRRIESKRGHRDVNYLMDAVAFSDRMVRVGINERPSTVAEFPTSFHMNAAGSRKVKLNLEAAQANLIRFASDE